MKLNGKTKVAAGSAIAAIAAALLTAGALNLKYRDAIKGEGIYQGTTSAQLTGLSSRMDRHVNMCDARMSGVVRELGEIRGTVDAIWRHLERNGARR